MNLNPEQKQILHHMGVDIYEEKTPPSNDICIKIFQCQLKNNQPCLIIADWSDENDTALQNLCDKMIAAIGSKQNAIEDLNQADLNQQKILTLGDQAKAALLKINSKAKISATYSLQDLLNNPSLKRDAWAIMQSL